MSDERRSSHRVRISGVRVSYESGDGEPMEADALDLGGGGLFIRTAAPLAVGKRISLEIQVIGETGPWSALGRVVWSRDKGEGDQAPPGMGVKLIDADDAVLTAIERLVQNRERTEPGVGKTKSSAPPPPAVVVVAPERERTLAGVGASGDGAMMPPEREASVAIDLVSRKPVSTAPPPARPAMVTPPPEKSGGGAGRTVVILLLMIIAGVAAYVLVQAFLHPVPGR